MWGRSCFDMHPGHCQYSKGFDWFLFYLNDQRSCTTASNLIQFNPFSQFSKSTLLEHVLWILLSIFKIIYDHHGNILKKVLIWSGLTRKFHQRFMKRIISTCTFQPTQLGNCWHTSICEEFKLAILFEYIEAPWSNTYIHLLCYSCLMSNVSAKCLCCSFSKSDLIGCSCHIGAWWGGLPLQHLQLPSTLEYIPCWA